MRTEGLRDFEEKLTSINGNFSQGLFLSEQFLVGNSELGRNNPKASISELFIDNDYSSKFDYKLEEIPAQVEMYRSSLSVSLYFFILSAFELYVESLSELVQILPERRRLEPTIINKSDFIIADVLRRVRGNGENFAIMDENKVIARVLQVPTIELYINFLYGITEKRTNESREIQRPEKVSENSLNGRVILDEVRDKRKTFEITNGNQVIACVTPTKERRKPEQISGLEASFWRCGSSLYEQIGEQETDREYRIATLYYFIWKRNCLMHADGKPDEKLLSLIMDKGKELNLYWKEQETKPGRYFKLNDLDFSAKRINAFHRSALEEEQKRPKKPSQEIIDVLQIFRVLAKRIDQQVLTFLRKEDILRHILEDFKVHKANVIWERSKKKEAEELKKQKLNSEESTDRIKNMFVRFAQDKFAIDKQDIDFSQIVF